MYKNNVSMKKEIPCVISDRPASFERLEKIEMAIDKLKSQAAWLQSLPEGE